ncbi:MAG: YceD family protein [Cyanobium sp.]
MNLAAGDPPPLRPVALPELRLLAAPRHWEVNQPIAGLESLTPVRGLLTAHHHSGVLEVEGEVETIVTLRCDRCLNLFNQALRAEAHELLELAAAGVGSGSGGTLPHPSRPLDPPQLTPTGDDLDDRLDPEGDFDPERWLFEQLSLRLPLVNRCGAECPGPATWSSEEGCGDSRWAALRKLKES